MPFVKCRFYTETGEPVRDGCRKKDAGCSFIHPDNPEWNKARPSGPSKDRSGDSGGFKSRGEWGSRSATSTAMAWDTGGNPGSATEASADWGTGSGWGTASGWGSGSGWGAGSVTSTSNRDAEPVRPVNSPATQSWDTAAPTSGWGQITPSSSEQAKGHENGWGGGTDSTSASTWGKSQNGGGWGATKESEKSSGSTWGSAWKGTSGGSWGENKDADKITDSTWGSAEKDAIGRGWGDNKDAGKGTDSAWGSAWKGASGGSWGDNNNTDKSTGSAWGSAWKGTSGGSWEEKKDEDKITNSTWGSKRKDGSGAGWGANDSLGTSDSMIVDNDPPKKLARKPVPPPPRIRIPDSENKPKTTGTNSEPLGTKQWGESRISNRVITSTPATISTPVTALTPIDTTRIKRKRDVALDDKSDAFKEYIKAWERGVRARFLLAEAEAKRDRWFRTQKSSCYARIGEAGRKRLDGQRTECDQEVNAQRDKLSAAITSLVEFHDTLSSKIDLGQRYNVGEEAQKFVQESRTFVDEVRGLLVAQVLKDKSDPRPDDLQKLHAATNPTSYDALQSQIRDLEERLDQAQTELTLRHRRDVHSEIEEILTAKITDMHLARQREIDRIASQPRPEIVIPPAALMKIEQTTQQVRELDAKVPQTVEDIRVLLLRVDATAKRVNELEQELSTNKEAYRKVQEIAAEKEAADRKMDERLGGIREQFEQLVASQSLHVTAQRAPSSTTQDKLIENILPAFEASLGKFYEREVGPAIVSMQRNVVGASERLQAEAIQVLWGKIKPAMNMVAEVSRWLDSQELEQTAPVQG